MSIAEDVIIGTSVEIQSIRNLVSRVADTNSTILISGESGTGKTLAAMTIHQMSKRAQDSLLQFDCAATSEKFLETELFGFEEAGNTKKGLLESANGRTVLLENIDQTPLQLQVKLLRVFQERAFSKRGGNQEITADCRFVSTSQRDMKEKVVARLLREDFYYRLNVIDIHMPALRDRPEDIKPLLHELLGRIGKDVGTFMAMFHSHGMLEYFEKYSWPGNVRELQQVVETLVLTEAWDSIKQLLLGHGNASSQMTIERCIEFPPEYHQSGVSLLSFFGEVLRRKYPDHKATVRIEQEGLKVRMIVEPLVGKGEVFERALDEYGLVLTGQITPDKFTSDLFLVNTLRLELRLAEARIESQKELLHYQEKNLIKKDCQIDRLTNLIEGALRSPQPQQFHINVSPSINSSVNIDLAVSTGIGDICNDLGELSSILGTSSDDVSSVEEIRQAFKKMCKSNADEARNSPAINKLEKLIERISDAESRIGKTIRVAEQGVALAQRLATHYNEIAQWLGLPQVPKPFLSGK